jgi:hypothetical protein
MRKPIQQTHRPLALTMLSMVMLWAIVGCGYRNDTLFRDGIETVCVEVFESKEFRRDLEFRLTEAVVKRINMDTPYRLASKEKADTILTGEVLEEQQAAFAPDYETRQPRDKQLVLSVRILWKDLRTGRVLVDVPVQLEAADYLPPAGESEAYAQDRAIDRLAAAIVRRMYTEDW